MRRSLLVAALMALATACGDSATNEPDSSALEMEIRVVFDDLPGSSPIAKTGADSEEECTTGCSLAKHHVPELTEHGFELAVQAYGKEAVDAPSESLETLLFYGSRTIKLMADIGTEGLSEDHLTFLRKELSRDKAWVSLRMVDDDEKVRVSYGPTLVPLGTKQHLAAVGENLKAMEFNGTVMRTGVNYLWSRY